MLKLKNISWRKRSRFPPFERRKGWGTLSCGDTVAGKGGASVGTRMFYQLHHASLGPSVARDSAQGPRQDKVKRPTLAKIG